MGGAKFCGALRAPPPFRNPGSATENEPKKIEICYVLAREGLAFLKYPAFHALAEWQGVELGSSYKTADNAKLFIHFIAESQRQQFLQSLSISSTPFFSFLLDGSTDAGNVEQELFSFATKMTIPKRYVLVPITWLLLILLVLTPRDL